MYIIEFEKGVYATEGEGDPSRTLKIYNAQKFSSYTLAEDDMNNTLERIKPYRKFSNPQVLRLDELSGELFEPK